MLATSSKYPLIMNKSKDFGKKTDLKELWWDRLIEILIANPSKLHFGQEVLYGDLQRLDYDMGDMHIPYPNIEEDIELISSVGTHETNSLWPP
jgi:hypothetical protein